MPEVTHCSLDSHPARIEPDNRLVVLARTIQVSNSEAEATLRDGVMNWVRFGDTCLGQALYRHRSVFQNAADAPMWSHLELSYFRDIVPADVILELVFNRQSNGVHLLRAEILLTTPSSFILPRDWRGSADRPERKASLEYIRVQPKHLRDYRNAMRDYCGLAAMKQASVLDCLSLDPSSGSVTLASFVGVEMILQTFPLLRPCCCRESRAQGCLT